MSATAKRNASSTSCTASASNPSRKASMTTLIKNRRIVENPPSSEANVVRLEPQDDPASVVDRLAGAARLEVNFPKFGDGRGYSIARPLGERYGHKGELGAIGQVGRGNLFYMEGVGFHGF